MKTSLQKNKDTTKTKLKMAIEWPIKYIKKHYYKKKKIYIYIKIYIKSDRSAKFERYMETLLTNLLYKINKLYLINTSCTKIIKISCTKIIKYLVQKLITQSNKQSN